MTLYARHSNEILGRILVCKFLDSLLRVRVQANVLSGMLLSKDMLTKSVVDDLHSGIR